MWTAFFRAIGAMFAPRDDFGARLSAHYGLK